MTVGLHVFLQKRPMESVMGQTEPCVKYSSGRVIKGEERAKASKYTEDRE